MALSGLYLTSSGLILGEDRIFSGGISWYSGLNSPKRASRVEPRRNGGGELRLTVGITLEDSTREGRNWAGLDVSRIGAGVRLLGETLWWRRGVSTIATR